MLYRIVKILMTLTLRLYFGRIRVRGMELIDREGPVIILANHTNSFMDAMLTGICVRRRIHFFVRGDMFAHRLADRLFRALGMLPVYRLSEGKDKLGLNDNSNQEATAVLERGGALLVFAEGRSEIEKILKPLKKGPFRLAMLVAEQTRGPLSLVPLGINYLEPMRTGTEVWMEAAERIDAQDAYKRQDGNAARAATSLLRQTTVDMERVVVHAGNSNDAGLLQFLLELTVQSAPPGNRLSFAVVKETEKRLSSASEAEKSELAALIARYREVLGALGVKQWSKVHGWLWLDVLLLAAGAIPALAGWLFHLIPVGGARRIADTRVRHDDFYASVFCVAALLLTLGWYVLALVAGLFFLKAVQVLLGLVLLGAAGVFWLRVYRPVLGRVVQLMQQGTLEEKYPHALTVVRELRSKIAEWSGGGEKKKEEEAMVRKEASGEA